jgi:predicted Ser/Thr protein kinase
MASYQRSREGDDRHQSNQKSETDAHPSNLTVLLNQQLRSSPRSSMTRSSIQSDITLEYQEEVLRTVPVPPDMLPPLALLAQARADGAAAARNSRSYNPPSSIHNMQSRNSPPMEKHASTGYYSPNGRRSRQNSGIDFSRLIPPVGDVRLSLPALDLPPRRSSPGSLPPPRASMPCSVSLDRNSAETRKDYRRCFSSRELTKDLSSTTLSQSPYSKLLHQKEEIEATMYQRLKTIRASVSPEPSNHPNDSNKSTGKSNDARNRRRAEHNQAVVDDLCDMVADLFMAESKLLNPSSFGFDHISSQRDNLLTTVQHFVNNLPPRYALGVDTPSEVLLHMRLMAAARSEDFRAAVHIINLDETTRNMDHSVVGALESHAKCKKHLVTISCVDRSGLLEFITKLLGSGGSRVIDADVMLSRDNIALDRFLVEMKGRLRIDKLQQSIEAYLKQSTLDEKEESDSLGPFNSPSEYEKPIISPMTNNLTYGALYFNPPMERPVSSSHNLQAEMRYAVPLSEIVLSSLPSSPNRAELRSHQERRLSDANYPPHSIETPTFSVNQTDEYNQFPGESGKEATCPDTRSEEPESSVPPTDQSSDAPGRRHPLVNREATYLSFGSDDQDEVDSDEFFIASQQQMLKRTGQKVVPIIPLKDLMLIETLGKGRVSTIYRAAWQKRPNASLQPHGGIKMVALKVATVDPKSGDAFALDELRHEADIAAMLQHKNICDLVGVANDSDCFGLAYEFCEGGSLLDLLADSSRYYEYLPIALDIASGMAYLHSRNLIHRDLKPSNILMTNENRAKVADFGMSVANYGQELTAETGTYRYMSPEVIRHESYSSNADVYSFGVLLWQLITREVPFATMSPIQTAYAVAQGERPSIPDSVPARLREIIITCWDQDSHKRPSFTYIAMALADYAKMAFNPANVGAQTVQIANEMLANVHGNSTVNVDFSTPVSSSFAAINTSEMVKMDAVAKKNKFLPGVAGSVSSGNIGLEI